MIKTCENCNKEWNARKSFKRFCGTQCAVEFRKVNPKACHRTECTVNFMPERPSQKYCSHSCAAKVSNSVSVKRTSKRPIRRCFCGVRLGSGNKSHCSLEHSFLYRRAYEINDWLNGVTSGSLKSGLLRRTLRDFLIEMAGHKCTICEWSVPNPVTGKPVLTVDHIDGNWKNNKVDNLAVLCYNCHTLTETFGYLNAGNELVTESRRASKRGGSYGL